MSVALDLQMASVGCGVPSVELFRTWASAALLKPSDNIELAVRVADEPECRQSNLIYRGIDRATNVLSFPSELPAAIADLMDPCPIGDLLICAPVVLAEARDQGKSTEAHFAHLVVHGVLHLMGHDHVISEEADKMERLEIEIMRGLGYPDPYRPTCQADGREYRQ